MSSTHKKKVGIGVLWYLVLQECKNASLIVAAIAGLGTWESWQRGLRQTGGMDEEVSALDVG